MANTYYGHHPRRRKWKLNTTRWRSGNEKLENCSFINTRTTEFWMGILHQCNLFFTLFRSRRRASERPNRHHLEDNCRLAWRPLRLQNRQIFTGEAFITTRVSQLSYWQFWRCIVPSLFICRLQNGGRERKHFWIAITCCRTKSWSIKRKDRCSRLHFCKMSGQINTIVARNYDLHLRFKASDVA